MHRIIGASFYFLPPDGKGGDPLRPVVPSPILKNKNGGGRLRRKPLSIRRQPRGRPGPANAATPRVQLMITHK